MFSVMSGSVAYTRHRLALSRREVARLRPWVSLPLVLWLMLWLSIDTGPWNLNPAGWGEHEAVNALRASFPLLSLGIALLVFSIQGLKHRPTLTEAGFWLYALTMLASSFQLMSLWFGYAYWALAFLATIVVVQIGLSSTNPVAFGYRLNVLSWIIATTVLLLLLFFARHALIGHASGYGIVNRVKSVGGVAMSRSSGLSRMAAVPAIASLVYVFRGRWHQRALSVLTFAGSVLVIWTMQSRGSLFAFLGAFLFVVLFGDKQALRVGLVALALLAIFALSHADSGGMLHQLWLHATRDKGTEGFHHMSGRPRIWHNAWVYIKQAPWVGYGPQADRRVMGEDAQGAIVYAMMSTGLVGTVWFVVAMVAAWNCLIKLIFMRNWLSHGQRTMVMIAGGILVFSTLRSIPEDTAAVFSIDLLLQYPSMVYLAVLHRRVRNARRAHRRRGFRYPSSVDV